MIYSDNQRALRMAYNAMISGQLTDDLKTSVRIVWEAEIVDTYAIAGLTEQQSLELARFVGVEFLNGRRT